MVSKWETSPAEFKGLKYCEIDFFLKKQNSKESTDLIQNMLDSLHGLKYV